MRAEARSGLLLSAPYTAFLLLFALFPIGFSVVLVLLKWDLVTPPSFAGLDDGDARVAYLEATAAAAWIEANTAAGQRAQLLSGLGEGRDMDAVLQEVLGADTEALDLAVQRWVRSEFPETVQRDAPPAQR